MFPSEEPRVNMAYCLLGLIAKQCLGASLLEVEKNSETQSGCRSAFLGNATWIVGSKYSKTESM